MKRFQNKMNLKKISFFVLLIAITMSGCGFQSLPQSKNTVEAALAEITNQYKRRADLIPNIVETVKGYAQHEKETLAEVVTARAKATQITIDPSKTSAAQLMEYQKNQAGLSQALGRLMVVAEKYPDLKANQNFRDLQVQLEGTENRITVARNRYIQAIQEFNNLVTVPFTSWTNSLIYKYEKMPQWSVSDEEKAKVEKAPEVKF